MKYAVVTSILLVGLACKAVDLANAQQPPLPPVTIDPSKPRANDQQGQQAARQNNAAKKKKRTAKRSDPPSPAASAPAPAGAGSHNPATNPNYNAGVVNLGPLGNKSVLDTPFSITAVPTDMLQNLQLKTVNDA